MLIKNITIENFQSYYGSQTLEFSKGLNLIIGKGGKGKSKLFNAFYWVLFGKIYITDIGWCTTDSLPHSAKYSLEKHGFINKKALYEAQKNDTVCSSVMLELEDDKGISYQIERAVYAIRLDYDDFDSNDAWDVKPNTLKISYDSPTGTIVRNDIVAENIISQLFPEGIRNYIWFQGESLESLINFRKPETLKAAVKHISYYPYYVKLSEIISLSKSKITSIESKKTKEANKHNQNVNALVSTIETKTKQIELEEGKRQKTEKEIDLIKIALAESENKISGLANFNSLVKQYDDCVLKITKINNEVNEIDAFQRKQLPNLWILRNINTMVVECKSIIEKNKEEEYTVPEKKYLDNPSRAKLEEILHDGKCFVCGSDVSEGTEAFHYIKERMRLQEEYLQEMEEYTNNMQFSKQFNMFIGRIQDYPDSLLISLNKIKEQWEKSEDRMEVLLAQRKKETDKKKELDDEIDNVKKKYGVDPIKQAQSADVINSGIRASRTNLERKQRELETSKQTIIGYKRELQKAEKELADIRSKDKSVTKVVETEWKDISIFLEDICKRVQENARKDLLRKIEDRANEFYNKFTEHDKGYKGTVKIGDDYSIEFDAGLNTSHEDRKKMSIINAILSLNQEAVGTYYPFISDAPTSSFDLETTHKYLLGIKDIFEQSIIMTKDVDLNSEQYKDLVNQHNVSRIYMLESELYSDEEKELGKHEVSTKVLHQK